MTTGFTPATKAHPALRAATRESLTQLVARLERHGVEVGWVDPDEIPGVARCFVDDPWGNRIELLA